MRAWQTVMKLQPMRRISPAVILLALAMIPGKVEAAGGEPVRSGTIVSGVYVTGPLGDCRWMPDCRAWLESDCNEALTGHDPAWLSSIVDVADLADGTTKRVFRWGPGDPVGLQMGGIVVQFWTEGCTEITSADWYSWEDSRGPNCCSSKMRTILRVPTDAKWMTVSGSTDNLHIVWALS